MESQETELTRVALEIALGDGCLSIQTDKKTGYRAARLALDHCAKQRPYLEHKVNELKTIWPTKAKIRDVYQSAIKGGPKKYPSSSWATNSPRFNAARNILYPRGYKEVTPALLSMLGAQAMAWLYMDDGHLCQRSGCNISMASHSKDEILMTRDWIEALTGARGEFYENPYDWGGKKRKEKMLRFSAKTYKKFLDVIRPYAAPSMEYKFAH